MGVREARCLVISTFVVSLLVDSILLISKLNIRVPNGSLKLSVVSVLMSDHLGNHMLALNKYLNN
jgi:hypothetical protein